MAEKQLLPRVSISNANLAPGPAVLWGADKYRQHVTDIGADGIEWMPLRGRLRAEAELGRQSMQGLVTSLHASFRNATLQDVVHRRVSPRELPFIAAMSRLDALRPLVVMQDRVGHSLPVVAYPNEQSLLKTDALTRNVDYTEWQGTFPSVRFQPTAELLHRWGVLSSDANVAMAGLKEVMADRGFDNVCFDTHHWTTERGGYVMPDWRAALPNLIRDGTAQEMHVCPARPDVGGSDQQLQLILDGHIDQTEIGDMITCVGENLPDDATGFYFVLELPYAATHDDVGIPRTLIGEIREHFTQAS